MYLSTAATNKSVSEFRGNTTEVTEVCERDERRAAPHASHAAMIQDVPLKNTSEGRIISLKSVNAEANEAN